MFLNNYFLANTSNIDIFSNLIKSYIFFIFFFNRKPRRRFEQKSLADFTILRSAPLKKHHVHEVLGKKLVRDF